MKPIRTEDELATDLKDIVRLRKKGKTYRQIGWWMNKNRPYQLNWRTYYDQYILFVEKEKADAKELQEAYVQSQLDEIDMLKKETLKSWKASKDNNTVITTKAYKDENTGEESDAVEVMRKISEQTGDVSYLNLYEKLLAREAKLLGLDSAEKKQVEVTDPEGIFSGLLIKVDTEHEELPSSEDDIKQIP